MTHADLPTSLGLTRRGLLLRGGVAAGAAALGGSAVLGGAAPANANVSTSHRFDLGGSGGYFFLEKQLHQPYWIMQSFAIDYPRGAIFYVQSKAAFDSAHPGDLWVTKTDLQGNILGSMTVHRFGHGVQIAVSYDNSTGSTWIWSEYDANSSSGFGTKLARWKFQNGAVLEVGDPGIVVVSPTYAHTASSSNVPEPAIDPVFNRFLVRYGSVDGTRVVAYSLADALAGNLGTASRLSEWACPDPAAGSGTFQGFTFCGQYYYQLSGAGGSGTTSSPCYIQSMDLNSGRVIDTFQTNAGGTTLSNREPEGMAIAYTGTSSNPRPWLAFGFKSSYVDTAGDREYYSTLFYKDQWTLS